MRFTFVLALETPAEQLEQIPAIVRTQFERLPTNLSNADESVWREEIHLDFTYVV
eukprot:SAG31_NODE_1621_length_7724_cov_3.297049_9_plen_54_part_01